MAVSNRGISHVLILVVALVVCLFGLLGYVYYDRYIAKDTIVEESVVAQDVEGIVVPEAVKTPKDIELSISALEEISPDQTLEDLDLITSQLDEF